MRFRRTVTAVALAAVAMTGLSACESKVGLAASVAGHRLSDSDLSKYVTAGAKPYSDGSSGTTVPKVFVVQNWILNDLFARAVTSKGGKATTTELNAARTEVLGGQSVNQAEAFYRKLGYTSSFGDLIIDQGAMLVVLVERIAPGITAAQAIAALQNGEAGSELVKAVTAPKSKVVVSSRYGTWDAAKVSLTSTAGVGAPSFVRFSTTTATATS